MDAFNFSLLTGFYRKKNAEHNGDEKDIADLKDELK
jgi:hypothetical protein